MILQYTLDLDAVLVRVSQGTVAVWLGLSAYVVVNRRVHDRRAKRIAEISRLVEEQWAAPTAQHSQALERLLAGLPRRVLYHMMSDVSLPKRMGGVVATYALARWGVERTVRDASRRHRGRWRRISALFALAHIRQPGVHDLLRNALRDDGPEVASAAAVILGRLEDRRAAGILIEGLRDHVYSPSRIATQLDHSAVDIRDLLPPLLADSRTHARLWGVSLLARFRDSCVDVEIAALADDESPHVRKAVVDTLVARASASAVAVALHALADPVGYVRATGIRALGKLAFVQRESTVLRAYARAIAPFLGDIDFTARQAAKETLVKFGPSVWREVAAQLDSSDRFARNGAAEVLQNLGLLDGLIDALGRGLEPGADLVDVVHRVFREGGLGMVDAAAARADQELRHSFNLILPRLRVARVQGPR